MSLRSLALAALIALPAVAAAQEQGADFDYNALMKAPAGAWAEYQMSMASPTASDKTPPKKMKMKYAVTDKSAKQIVVEIDTETPMGAIDVQMTFAPSGADAWKLAAGKMKMGAQTMELPQEQLKQTGLVKKGNAVGTLVGTEKITVPAGTFDTKHYKKKVKDQSGQEIEVDMWMNDTVMPSGMVKSEAKAKGLSVVLSATGKDAKSSFAK